MKTYKSYVFKTKDPIIDALRTAYEDAGGSYKEISARSGVSYSTIHNWFHGKTRRPQFATVAEVAIACGKHGIAFGSNGPRLIGRATPEEQRAFTGKRRKRA
jgi:transcriptional regulator with XRE-family HTH domain